MKKHNTLLLTAALLTFASPAVADMSGTHSGQPTDKDAARMSLAPHSVMIETSLQAARVETNGLLAELKATGNQPPNADFSKHLGLISKDLGTDLKTVKVHQQELSGSVKHYPEIATSTDYQAVNSSLDSLQKAGTAWQTKLSSPEYWHNRQVVMADIEGFMKRIDNAIDKTKSFNSNQLDVSAVG